jgi:hypothetical protein
MFLSREGGGHRQGGDTSVRDVLPQHRIMRMISRQRYSVAVMAYEAAFGN